MTRKLATEREKRKARKKVKEHVEKFGEEVLTEITPRMVGVWWTILNVAVFDGSLTRPKRLTIKAFRDDLGWCVALDDESNDIHMGIRRDKMTRKIFLDTLVHEMVHQWEHEVYGRMTHGKLTFMPWRAKIYRRVRLKLEVTGNTVD